jgi:hypothetical protein
MENVNVEENAKRIIERVKEAAIRSGRDADSVTLVAASKMNDAERVRRAFNAGIRFFGENRVQEMEEKRKANAYEGAGLHFIGHLQRNKVKNVVGLADVIESVDSKELLELIGKRATALGIVQQILIEVNIGGEEAKSGVAPEELSEIIDYASEISGIFVRGLMTIPPISEKISDSAVYFSRMWKLFVDISAKKYDNIKMNTLSMGMSADFETAIMEGANTVRVGSGIFGKRNYT